MTTYALAMGDVDGDDDLDLSQRVVSPDSSGPRNIRQDRLGFLSGGRG